MAINVFLIISNIILLVTGQTLWKLGLNKIGSFELSNLSRILFSPYIISGIFLYGIATVLWLAILSRLPLSLAYPLQSLAYVAGMIIALYLFNETIPVTRWIGVGIILVGVSVLSLK